MLRSPLDRDGPLLWPLRTGRGAMHAHARARASTRGRPLPKLRGKRVRHGRKRESRSAGTHRLSERIAAVSAPNGPDEPPRRRSRASRNHWAPGHQTAHENHTEDVSTVSAGLESWLTQVESWQREVRGARLGAIEGLA